ncbi:uracil phosphoribosyltransferase [Mycoplasma phocimorsus]|uniref:Uracil phosphoribosyltransferase n=1 Tax=Mycoplasma phocimorsus TaxID=3045839 RepID=A0AAJ1PSJ1_9MOLU|nr:uracil phosphoribosyltransferase [Mycoplasma phocimorsus]MDJ1645978.1 uracil phosphoribosyltransferase [Mycoplasma phocimorsus]MDJ1646264.1 uracil phosphoribosyltransferase [Mycoplasma phocimorsus]MDJ1646866.1 uracil phosphoribosyltransferase [Mycoplasma phocimorsus]MDJ1647835.1 uracil phosphoribosyltransferase [Mycoplasma phocimorsus]MDJ1648466.1 uracil phosphoribosyltransferase [Mycoplasma phocimorsus]
MLKILNHPLIDMKLTMMRKKDTDHTYFRKNLNEIASLMVYEILRTYKTKDIIIQTPIVEKFCGKTLDKEIIIVPILRAGLGMTEGILNLVPEARLGHIGMYRDEVTFEPHTYFYKMPQVEKDSYIFVVDPMLATGNSAIDAIKKLQEDGYSNIQLVCLVGSPEGVEKVNKEFNSKINIYLAALDEKLNDDNYIVPGLGDAGDRLFGTK